MSWIRSIVPKKGDSSNPSNYCPIALFSCFSGASQAILNGIVLKHLSASDVSHRMHGFHTGRSSGNFTSQVIPDDRL